MIEAEKTVEEIKEMTIEVWSRLPSKPTLEIDCRFGKVFCVCDRGEYDKLIAEGNVCLSPLELRELVIARRTGAVPDDLVEALVLAKREFLGAKLDRILQAGRRVAGEATVEPPEKKPPLKPGKTLPDPVESKQLGLI